MSVAADLLVSNFARIDVNSTVAEAQSLFEKTGFPALLVYDEREFKGILTPKEIMGVVKHHKAKVSKIYRGSPRVLPSTPLEEVAKLMIENDVKFLPVISGSRGNKVIGVVKADDILKKIVSVRHGNLKVRDIVTENVIKIGINEKISKALELLRENNISHLPVVENEKLVGMLTLRSLYELMEKPQTRKGFGEFPSRKIRPLEVPVSSAMSRNFFVVTREQTVSSAIDEMMKNSSSCLVLVDRKGKPMGIMTKTDLLELIATGKFLPGLLIQLSGEVEDIREFEVEFVRSTVQKLVRKIPIKEDTRLCVYVKRRGTKSNPQYHVRLRIFTLGSVKTSTATHWSFDSAFLDALERLERIVLKEIDRKRTIRRQGPEQPT